MKLSKKDAQHNNKVSEQNDYYHMILLERTLSEGSVVDAIKARIEISTYYPQTANSKHTRY